MADTRAERLARRTSGRATTEPATNTNSRGRPCASRAPERDAEPRVEHPEDDGGHDSANNGGNDGDGEGASSQHPSRRMSASTQGRAAPSPATALLMAQELMRYRPTQANHDAWLGRLEELINTAAVPAPAPAPSRSLVHHSGHGGNIAHVAPPPPPPPPLPPPAGAPAGNHHAASHASSPHDCQIIQRTPPDARRGERQRDRHNRVVKEIAAAGRQNRNALTGGAATFATGCKWTPSKS